MNDILGSVEHMIDSNADVRVSREYDAFGNVLEETHYNTSGTPVTSGQTGYVDEAFAFTGRWFDKNTDLQNNLNRWYDADTGRWLSEDPIGFLGGDTNLYRYVGNEPTGNIDPSGLAIIPGVPAQPPSAGGSQGPYGPGNPGLELPNPITSPPSSYVMPPGSNPPGSSLPPGLGGTIGGGGMPGGGMPGGISGGIRGGIRGPGASGIFTDENGSIFGYPVSSPTPPRDDDEPSNEPSKEGPDPCKLPMHIEFTNKPPYYRWVLGPPDPFQIP